MAISGTFSKANAVNFKDQIVEISLDGGSTWAAIESWTTDVQFARGRHNTRSKMTLDGSTHLLPGAHLGPGKATVTCIYDEVTTGAYKNIEDTFSASSSAPSVELRWVPKADDTSATGNFRYTTSGGYLTYVGTPNEDDEYGMFTFEIDCDDVGYVAL